MSRVPVGIGIGAERQGMLDVDERIEARRPSVRANTKYSPQVAQVICERIMNMETLSQICRDPQMPAKRTVIQWFADPSKAEFRDMYYYARRVQAEMYVDMAMDIVNDNSEDWIQTFDKHGEPNGWKPNHETSQNKKLRIDTIKWNATKMLPRLYGEKLEVEHGVTGDLAELIRSSSNNDQGLPKPVNEL